MKAFVAGLSLFLLLYPPAVGNAHEGHDHGAPPPPVSTSIAPRFETSTEAFELVGVLRDGKLTLHLDRFVGNAPVPEAEIEVETPAGPQKARALGGGRYELMPHSLPSPAIMISSPR